MLSPPPDSKTGSAHRGQIKGIAPLSDLGALTWGNDWFLRKWNSRGSAEFACHQGSYINDAIQQFGRIATASADRTVGLWSKTNGERVATLRHDAAVNRLAAMHTPRDLLVSGSADHTVRTWDPQQGKQQNVFTQHSDCVNSVDVTGPHIVSGGADGAVWCWTPMKNQQRLVASHDAPVNWVGVSLGRVFSASADGTASVSDLGGDGTVRKARLSEHPIERLAIASDGLSVVAWVPNEKGLTVWNWASDERVVCEHEIPVTAMSFDCDRLISGTLDGTVFFWKTPTHCVPVQKRTTPVSALSWRIDTRVILAGWMDGALTRIDPPMSGGGTVAPVTPIATRVASVASTADLHIVIEALDELDESKRLLAAEVLREVWSATAPDRTLDARYWRAACVGWVLGDVFSSTNRLPKTSNDFRQSLERLKVLRGTDFTRGLSLEEEDSFRRRAQRGRDRAGSVTTLGLSGQ